MTETQLYILLTATITAGLSALGVTATTRQAYQSTITGTPPAPVVLLSNVKQRRYGFLERLDTYDPDTDPPSLTHTETQNYETTFQANCLVPPVVPTSPPSSAPSANDILQSVAGILESDATVAVFVAAGIGVQRISDVRQPYFTDDMNEFEASPSFDFTLTYSNSVSTTTAGATAVGAEGVFAI